MDRGRAMIHTVTPPRAWADHARPRFFVAHGARPAAERWHIRNGHRVPDWTLRDRAVQRFEPDREYAMLSPREARERESWAAAYFGPTPEMRNAIRLIRRSRILAGLRAGLRVR